MQPGVPHRRRRGTKEKTKKKNRQGVPNPKTKSKPKLIIKPSLVSNKRITVYYKERHNKYINYKNRRPTEEERAPIILQKAARGTPPCRPPTPRHRRGRPSLRGEGQQQKVKQARSTCTHTHDMQHTCHGHDACERTCRTNTHQYIYTHPDTGKQFLYQIKSPSSQNSKKTRKEQNKPYKSRVTFNKWKHTRDKVKTHTPIFHIQKFIPIEGKVQRLAAGCLQEARWLYRAVLRSGNQILQRAAGT